MARAAAVTALVLAASLAACTATTPDGDVTSPAPTPTPTPDPVHVAELRLPDDEITVLEADDPAARAVATSEALFAAAPVAVVAPADDPTAQARGAAVAVALGAPLLLSAAPEADSGPEAAPDGAAADESTAPEESEAPGQPAAPRADAAVEAELERLEVLAVVTVGDVAEPGVDADVIAAPADDGDLADLLRLTLGTEPVPADGAVNFVAGLDRDAPVLPAAESDAEADAEGDADAQGEAGAQGEADAQADAETDAEETDGPTSSPTGSPATDEAPEDEAPGDEDASPLPRTELADAPDGGLVLTTGDAGDVASLATARAAGLGVLTVPDGDPRSSSSTVQAFAETEATTFLALGPAFGPADELGWKVETAATGVELPGGGQVLFPGRRMIALYGTPGTAALGLLGEQDLPGSIARAQSLAAEYEPLTDDVVVPAFEMIVTIASASAGADGNYTNELPVETFVPWIEAARDAGIYVVIDLQPGRTDFVTQAQLYEELLLYPNVGLALDPEWRLEPDQVHLRQIGSVHIDEVNAVATYLADLTRTHALPQKLLVLHQFKLTMIEERERLDTSRDEISILIHADGQGGQGAKAGTWQALRATAPEGITWGWKNFIDEDVPMLTPEQTYQVEPVPEFVSYQ